MPIIKISGMKYIIPVLVLTLSVFAEELPPATQILSAARAQLPPYPVVMKGLLTESAENGFVRKTLLVEMELDWAAQPSRAIYRIRDTKKETEKTLEVVWGDQGPEYSFTQNGAPAEFDPNAEIEGIGATWSDLSFSFLWDSEAKTMEQEESFGKTLYKISIPRPNGHTLLVWVEKDKGRMMKAEEYDADQQQNKIIKVVSVKEFDGLWMVKDLDIIRPSCPGRTSLRIDSVDAR